MKIPLFTLRGFKRPREAVKSALGELEREVMEEIWRRGETSVREIHAAFDERAAYTTLMTTLDRLHKKGLLERRKDGRAFLYAPRISREDFTHSVAKDVIDGLLGQTDGETNPILVCIIDAVGERDSELLDELEKLLKEKRRKLKSEK
ncbi:MAG: BlaI/MecI/CopY family transcriptional regulator [Acidobacteria bacterium]|jgi:predicted transcriptional regulator|nr:BlaI/MecI/CopY family transcriptional regulator [Acidobacteriota bacterium]